MGIAANTDYPPAQWQALQVSLERSYTGTPVGKSGTYPGVFVTLCELLKGSLKIERDGCTIETDAKDKAWIINAPGERTQHFSNDAYIVSIHLSLNNPGNGAEWRGPSLALVNPDAKARESLNRIPKILQDASVPPEQREIRGLSLPLPHALSLQAVTTELFIQILRLVRPMGIRYEVPQIEDSRVRESHLKLANMPMQEKFSRVDLAAEQGLTAGQLDRLWRRELGITPQVYRDQKRIAYACHQLRLPDISVKAIAADLGFRHLSQFSNWFHAHYKESPRCYRSRPDNS